MKSMPQRSPSYAGLVLAATEARFSQVIRIRVQDVQIASDRLMVPKSRKGKFAKSGHIAIPVGRDVMDQLASATVGRPADEILLHRWRKVQRKGSLDWHRGTRGLWQSSFEVDRAWDLIVARAGLQDAVPTASDTVPSSGCFARTSTFALSPRCTTRRLQ